MANEAPPLDGVRVLDLTMNLPGPYATQCLAALGADVIKVEPPRGDTARMVPGLFGLVNRGKRSLRADLQDEAQRRIVLERAREADVLVEGFRPGVMARLGLDPETLRVENPRLVYVSISGFGQSGPYRDWPAHDLNLQALSGVAHLQRGPDGRPLGCALPIADLSAGLLAVAATNAALFARERSGEGRHVDVSLADATQSFAFVWSEGLSPDRALGDAGPKLVRARAPRGLAPTLERTARAAQNTLLRSDAMDRIRRAGLHALPHYGVFETSDGRYLSVGIVDEDKFWRPFARAIGLGKLAALPLPARAASGPILRRAVRLALARRTRDEWLARIDRSVVPIAPILTPREAVEDAQLSLRMSEPSLGPLVPAPLAAAALGRPPTLGRVDEPPNWRARSPTR